MPQQLSAAQVETRKVLSFGNEGPAALLPFICLLVNAGNGHSGATQVLREDCPAFLPFGRLALPASQRERERDEEERRSGIVALVCQRPLI